MSGVNPIPESNFTGRSNTIFAAEVDVEVFGDNFLPAYTIGDNSNVVATDTMKNFVLRQALDFEGATLEGFLSFLGERFLATYPQMQSLRLTGKEPGFDAAPVPDEQQSGFAGSDVLFGRSLNDHGFASLDMERNTNGVIVTNHRCGRLGLKLI